jgi:hypothetical protein
MMIGSVAIGAWVVRIVFIILVVQALIEDKIRVAIVAVGLALFGWAVVGHLNANLVLPYLAVVDIGLVFVVLGRDLRLN